ncbi:MAG: hypothetical protein QGI45_12585 [Myxococcota bacterium]|jgi:hypothetical protein|nr:hypothetical protein [Myxococcota bacterium]
MSRKAATDFFERIAGDIELKRALRLLLKDKNTQELMPALVGFARQLGFYFKSEEFIRVLWSKVDVPVEEKRDPYAHVLRGFFHHYAPVEKVEEPVALLAQNTNEEKNEDAAIQDPVEQKDASEQSVNDEQEQGA